MDMDQWEIIYSEILEDMGYLRSQDEASARLLRHLMINKNLIDAESLRPLMASRVCVVGAAATVEELADLEGTIVCAGSAASVFAAASKFPDILVTDLDGQIEDQIRCCSQGAVAVIHAHGDNDRLIQRYAPLFDCPIIPTTQAGGDLVLMNFGGFTDGDRAVCMARHLGAKEIHLVGFDFENPVLEEGEDPVAKVKKLSYARRIIFDHNPSNVSLIRT